MDWNFDRKLLNAVQKNMDDQEKKGFSLARGTVWAVIALATAVVLFNSDAVANKIVEEQLGLSETQKEMKIRNAKTQIHIAQMRDLRAQNDAWVRINKLQRSARTEEQHTFYRSEAAKLRMLGTASEREFKWFKEKLATATEKDLDEIIEKINQ